MYARPGGFSLEPLGFAGPRRPVSHGGVEGDMPDRPSAKTSTRNTNPAGARPPGPLRRTYVRYARTRALAR